MKSIHCASVYYRTAAAQQSLAKAISDASITFLDYSAPFAEIAQKLDNDECSILITEGGLLSEVLKSAKLEKLQWIHSTLAGVDKLCNTPSFELLKKRKNRPTITRTSFTNNMAAYCLGWITNQEHHFQQLLSQQQNCTWNKLKTRPLSSVVVGILGVGDVGQGIAASMKSVNMKTIGYSHWTKEAPFIDQVFPSDLESVLAQSDYIINSLPNTAETTDMLSGDVLRTCKKKPVFINVGRGNVINEQSIISALDNNWISKAILDVFLEEPLPAESALWKHPGVIVTPHVAGGPLIDDCHPFINDSFKANWMNFQQGKPLNLCVDYSKGY